MDYILPILQNNNLRLSEKESKNAFLGQVFNNLSNKVINVPDSFGIVGVYGEFFEANKTSIWVLSCASNAPMQGLLNSIKYEMPYRLFRCLMQP